MTDLAAHREALRARQGQGARYDAANAPAEALDRARRSTAYFARLLNNLSNQELTQYLASDIARICLDARAMCVCFAGLPRGRNVMFSVPNEELEHSATLPAHALRHLFAHTVVHLNTEWRDLEDLHWQASVFIGDTGPISVSDLPDLRAFRLCETSLLLGGRERDWPTGICCPKGAL